MVHAVYTKVSKEIYMLYSFIIPCYCSSATVGKVTDRIRACMERLELNEYEIILVNDASPDEGRTRAEIKRLADEEPHIAAVDLAKNAGQHNALMAGLNIAKGDAIISVDDDNQVDPAELPKLLDKFDEGYDIVYGYYPEKKHSVFRNFGSAVNSWSFRVLTGKPKWLKTSSFWIIRRFVRDEVIRYRGRYTHLQGLFIRTTDNIACVAVEHHEREVGRSGYTLKKLIGMWSNVMGFSVAPLRMATRMGSIFSVIGFLAAIIIVIRKLLHPAMAVGWASTMAGICFFSGIILLFMGLIGEYVGRMYISQSAAPQYVVREIYRGGRDDGKKVNS